MTVEAKPKARKPRAKSSRPGANGSNGNSASKRTELAAELTSELNTLRAALDEMSEHYRLRAGAQITELLQLVEGQSEPVTRAPLAASVLQPMIEQLKEVRLKPHKGRAKDFVRLQELLEELTDLLPPER